MFPAVKVQKNPDEVSEGEDSDEPGKLVPISEYKHAKSKTLELLGHRKVIEGSPGSIPLRAITVAPSEEPEEVIASSSS